jgi:hypothetical protein
MQAELSTFDEETMGDIDRFVTNVEARTATPEEAEMLGKVLQKRGFGDAAKALGGVLKDITTDVISSVIVKTWTGG